ncbi:ankyrin repeat-containing domain protein [Nemania sp. FL0916]|nr:ankyrin repeat-containing domain protein [Nemania sp. FL0916]
MLQSRSWINHVFTCNGALKLISERLPSSPTLDPRTSLLDAVSSLDPNGTFLARDERGRLPLHYAAAYGFQHYCVGIFRRAEQYTNCLSPDNFGDTPLALAVAAGHTDVVELFVSKLRALPNGSVMPEGLIGRMILLSIRANQTDVSRILIKIGHELDFSGKGYRTPLYYAAQSHQLEVVKLLIQSSVDVNVKSSSRLWTPLIVATIHGHLDVVKELLQAGADITCADRRGWTAAHHAAYRGHLKIVPELHFERHNPKEPPTKQPMAQKVESLASDTHPITTIMLGTEENGRSLLNTDFSYIFVNIGPFNLYKTTQPIDLKPYTNALLPERLPMTCRTLEISASGCEEKYCVQLPILGDLTNSPWEFSTRTPETARLAFKIHETNGSQNNTIYTGIAILGELASGLGPYRATVSQDYTIPLVGQMGAYAGTLNFTFIISRPVIPPPLMVQKQRTYSSGTTKVGAHRGLGQNNTKHEHMQIGENTMQVRRNFRLPSVLLGLIADCVIIRISNKTRSFFRRSKC